MAALNGTFERFDWSIILGACRTLVSLYDQGALQSPRLRIAREIEGDLVGIAEAQFKAAEHAADPQTKQTHLAIAAFLCGAALEDALRRLCDRHGATYDPSRTTIARLQQALYSPSSGAEFIDGSENKQITAWSDTRNKADHGKFSEIRESEVNTMLIGARAFIDRRLR